MQTLFLKEPASQQKRLAIIFMVIDVSNFTSSDGFGIDILF